MRKTVSFVSVSDIYNHIGFNDSEIDYLIDNAWIGVSYGDAVHTLIGNYYALACITDTLSDYYAYDEPERVLSKDEITQKFWEIVGNADYVDMEN